MNAVALEPLVGRCRAYRPGLIEFKLASEPWELAGYYGVRRAAFCREQGIFSGSDVDDVDRHALPLVAIVHTAGVPDRVVGAVRIFEASHEPGTWFGGRLTTTRDMRRVGKVGCGLIETAVSAAHALGCQRFFAYVQQANERYFQRYHFRTLDHVDRHGHPHAFMQADLAHYPPRAPSGLFPGLPSAGWAGRVRSA